LGRCIKSYQSIFISAGKKNDSYRFFEKILGPSGSLLAGIAAIMALYTWKKQLKYENKYKTMKNLEEVFITELSHLIPTKK